MNIGLLGGLFFFHVLMVISVGMRLGYFSRNGFIFSISLLSYTVKMNIVLPILEGLISKFKCLIIARSVL